jgi:hypothetical protein
VSSQSLSRRWFIPRDNSFSGGREDKSLKISKSPTVNSFCFDQLLSGESSPMTRVLLVDGMLLSDFAFRRRISCPSHELDGFGDEEWSNPSWDFGISILMLMEEGDC